MGTLVPSQDYDNTLVVVSGYTGMHDLQYVAEPAAGEDFVKGSIVSLDATGKMVAGLDKASAMPMWAITGVNDFDANSDVGNVSGGHISAYPATGGYEIFTTEFVTDTYLPNDLLTAATGADAGQVKLATAGVDGAIEVDATETIVGVVSKGSDTAEYGQATLQFWTVYIPAIVNNY